MCTIRNGYEKSDEIKIPIPIQLLYRSFGTIKMVYLFTKVINYLCSEVFKIFN